VFEDSISLCDNSEAPGDRNCGMTYLAVKGMVADVWDEKFEVMGVIKALVCVMQLMFVLDCLDESE
jgi:hypothetical protein